jgi:trehalose-6-phosphate synthase
MAHQIGFASEDEANYVAYLVCRRNPDPLFQYSGNYMAMKYALSRLNRVNPMAYKKLKRTISPGVSQDLAENQRYWEKYQNPLETFSDWFYDLFLKANQQTDGIQSYTKVVELLMGEYRKNKLN